MFIEQEKKKRKESAQKNFWSKDLGTLKDLLVIELHTQP